MSGDTFSTTLSWLKAAIDNFPDSRTGKNCQFTMRDAAVGAFSVFLMQSRSFLEHQKWLAERNGSHNVLSIFGVENIPSDNHIRRMLDPLSPDHLFPAYSAGLDWLKNHPSQRLQQLKHVQDTHLSALDGTDFFSSTEVHCANCSTKTFKDGHISYAHKAITPALVHPGSPHVIPLPQEFIVPQDGHNKQDCENAAAKRWLSKYGNICGDWGMTCLGDDLYSCQPVCESVLKAKCHFIFVCKDLSHKYLTNWAASAEIGKDIKQKVVKQWTGKRREYHTYQFMNNVPIKEGADAMLVNWACLKITDENGKLLHTFCFITDIPITEQNIIEIIAAGRCRWKIENENNNILKQKGYHIDHNFGHGKKHLANLLLSLNIYAFFCHTLLHFFDKRYAVLRNRLSSRRRFFTDLIALTTYMVFGNWENLLQFMLKGLKIPDPGG